MAGIKAKRGFRSIFPLEAVLERYIEMAFEREPTTRFGLNDVSVCVTHNGEQLIRENDPTLLFDENIFPSSIL
jgi:hypothetical protein